MKTKSISSRRRFFLQASAALSVPLAASAVHARQAGADDAGANARLAVLEDKSAIRALQQEYVRHVNSGAHEKASLLFANPSAAWLDASVRSLAANGFGEQDAIEISPDHSTATARTHCAVQTETAIGPNCTLVEMARGQGEGVLRQSENRVLVSTYVKVGGAWKIERLVWERL